MENSIDPEQQASKLNTTPTKRSVLSDATLKIVHKGPEEVNITIVDIPGLVSCNTQPTQMFNNLADGDQRATPLTRWLKLWSTTT